MMIIFYILFFLILIYIVLNLNTKKSSTCNVCEKFETNVEPIYNIGLLGIVKNEEMIIEEWIQHYLWQGVDHFYIIDNGSTDKTKEKLQPYIDNNIITYYYLDERNKQEEHYNYVYNDKCKYECKWLIICDVDEYIYNRTKGNSIGTFINNLDRNNINSISLNWKMFGSSNYKNQPIEVRRSFLWRANKFNSNIKTIINTQYTRKISIHDHEYINGIKILNPPELAINHYAIMSREYFEKVKMVRGAADGIQHENIRTWDYFNSYDSNELYDDELAKIIL